MRPHRSLLAWQRAMDLYVEMYRATRNFPREELFGLVSQMRRAALSVPSNLAEGAGRKSNKEFLLFLSHASGSLSELDTQIEASLRVGLLKKDSFTDLQSRINEVSALIAGLAKKLRSD